MFHRSQPHLRRTNTLFPPGSAPDDSKDHRIQQVATTSGTTTTYIGALEEPTTTGSTTTATAYYAGLALAVNGPLSYTLSDALASVTVALDGSGDVTATQLYGPYSGPR